MRLNVDPLDFNTFFDQVKVNGGLPQGIDPSHENDIVLKGQDGELRLVNVLDASKIDQAEIIATKNAFMEMLSTKFSSTARNYIDDLMEKQRIESKPLTMRSIMQWIDVARMNDNIRQQVSTKLIGAPSCFTFVARLDALDFPGDKPIGMEKAKDELQKLAEECAKRYEAFVHGSKGADLAKALAAGSGKVYAKFEAYSEVLAELNEKLLNFEAAYKKALPENIQQRERYLDTLAELADEASALNGALHRTTAALMEAAEHGDKSVTKLRLREFFEGPKVKGGAVNVPDPNAKNVGAISLALGTLLNKIAEVDGGNADMATVKALREEIADVLRNVVGGPVTGDVNKLALKQFGWQLQDADKRLGELEKALETEKAGLDGKGVVKTLKDAGFIQKVMNGEADVNFLVQVKKLGATDKMANPQFAEKNLVGKLKQLGSGSVNTVQIGTYKNPVTGVIAKGVVKTCKESDMGATDGTLAIISGSHFSQKEAKTLQRNVATSVASNLINAGGSVTQAGVTTVKGNLAIVQEVAEGTNGEAVTRALLDGNEPPVATTSGFVFKNTWQEGLTLKQQGKLIGQMFAETNRLEWSDWLTGQQDRHMNNLMIDVQGNLENGDMGFRVSIKGIDNDQCFSASRIGLQKFQFTDPEMLNFLKTGVRGDYKNPASALPEKDYPDLYTGNDPAIKTDQNGVTTVDLTKMSDGAAMKIVSLFGINNIVKPTFVTKDVFDATMAEGKREKLEAELKELLSPAEVKAALMRFDEMKAYMQELSRQGKVYDAKTLEEEPLPRQKVRDLIVAQNKVLQRKARNNYVSNGGKITTEVANNYMASCMAYAGLLLPEERDMTPLYFSNGGDMKVEYEDDGTSVIQDLVNQQEAQEAEKRIHALLDKHLPTTSVGEVSRATAKQLLMQHANDTAFLEVFGKIDFSVGNGSGGLLALLQMKPADRTFVLNQLAVFGYTNDESLIKAIGGHIEALKAKLLFGGTFSAREMLEILVPDARPDELEDALKSEPAFMYGKLCGQVVPRVVSQFLFDTESIEPYMEKLAPEEDMNKVHGVYASVSGFVQAALASMRMDEIFAILTAKRVDVTKLPSQIYVTGQMSRTDNIDTVQGLMVTDIIRSNPIVSYTLPEQPKKTTDFLAMMRANNKNQNGSKSLDGKTVQPIVEGMFNDLLTLCHGNALQAAMVALTITQNDQVALMLAGATKKPLTGLVTGQQVDITPAEDGKVIVKVQYGNPDVSVHYSLTRAYYPDGHVEMLEFNNLKDA